MRTSGAYATATSETRDCHRSCEQLNSLIRSKRGVHRTEIKKHKKGFAVSAAVVFALVFATVGYFVFARRTVALTDKDTILISDFVNTTGDGVFDGTLKQGLAVQLGQSPYLSLFPDARVRQTLRLMGHSPDDRVTQEIGQRSVNGKV